MSLTRISVLTPVIHGVHYIQRMLQSFERTVTSQSESEVIFHCDPSDEDTIRYLVGRPYKVVIDRRPEGRPNMARLYNDLGKVANGELFMYCTDDMVFQTPNWASRIIAEARRYPDGIFTFGVNAGLHNDSLIFMITSRRLIEILGSIGDEWLASPSTFLRDAMKPFSRAIAVPDVTIQRDSEDALQHQIRSDANSTAWPQPAVCASDDNPVSYTEAINDAVGQIRGLTTLWADIIWNNVSESVKNRADRKNVLLDRFDRRSPSSADPRGLHYSRKAITGIIQTIARNRLCGGTAVLSRHTTGVPNIVWAQIFDRVIALNHGSGSREPILNDKCEINFGSVGDTKFMYQLVETITDLRAVIIDDEYYSHIISPYFLLKAKVEKPGIIIWPAVDMEKKEFSGAKRFIADLTSGLLDNRRHDLTRFDAEPLQPCAFCELVG